MDVSNIKKLKIVKPTDTPDDFVHGALWLLKEIEALPDDYSRLFGLVDPAPVVVQCDVTSDLRHLAIFGIMARDDNFDIGYSARIFPEPIVIPMPTKQFASALDFIKYIRMYDAKNIYPDAEMPWTEDTPTDEIKSKVTTLLDFFPYITNECISHIEYQNLRDALSELDVRTHCLFIH